jgi:hypothetical protein
MSPAPSLQDLVHLVETETEDGSPLGRLRAASDLARQLAEAGDAALGYFVDQARHAGHSWSQIGDALGVSKQAAQQRHTVRQAAGVEEPAYAYFTPRARNAVDAAEPIARDWGHNYVGTEHLLLALYRDPQGVGPQVLVGAGLDEDRARTAVEDRVGRGETAGADAGAAKLPLTPKAQAAVDGARSAAWDLGHNYVGTEHLLIALHRVDGVAKEVLDGAGLTPELTAPHTLAKLEAPEQR